MKVLNQVLVILGAIIITSVVFSAYVQPPRALKIEVANCSFDNPSEFWFTYNIVLNNADSIEKREFEKAIFDLKSVRTEVRERVSHFEQLLVAIGSVQLGIMAFIVTVVFGKDFKSKFPKQFFWISIGIIGATALAYLHSFQVYVGYSLYSIKLENFIFQESLRPLTEVHDHLSNPNLHPFISTIALTTTSTLYFIGFYPVFLLIGAIIGFGKPLNISYPKLLLSIQLIIIVTLTFIIPILFELSKVLATY